jgi:hypothetical protein
METPMKVQLAKKMGQQVMGLLEKCSVMELVVVGLLAGGALGLGLGTVVSFRSHSDVRYSSLAPAPPVTTAAAHSPR